YRLSAGVRSGSAARRRDPSSSATPQKTLPPDDDAASSADSGAKDGPMLQSVTRKFASGCMMLARRRGDAVEFLGSAFLVDSRGYLLTAAHLVADVNGLVVVPTEPSEDFSPMTAHRVAAMPVSVSASDIDHDVA